MEEITYPEILGLIAKILKDYPTDQHEKILTAFQTMYATLNVMEEPIREGVLKIFFEVKDELHRKQYAQ